MVQKLTVFSDVVLFHELLLLLEAIADASPNVDAENRECIASGTLQSLLLLQGRLHLAKKRGWKLLPKFETDCQTRSRKILALLTFSDHPVCIMLVPKLMPS